MSRIVIVVDPNQAGGVSCSVLTAPFQIAGLHTTHGVTIDDLVNLPGPHVVQKIGEGLADRIRSNLKVAEVIQMALGQPTSVPIFFRISDEVASALSWEALRIDNRFLALERWPVARVPSGVDIPPNTNKEYTPPLRLVVVVSALGRPGIAEWEGIYGGVTAARAAGLPIKVTLFAAEDEVVTAAQAAAAADPDLALEGISASPGQLISRIGELDPHLLHFYCHGAIAPGARLLDIGTATDWDSGAVQSSVRLNIEELGEALRDSSIWAVALNTCQSAAPPANGDDQFALSHAERLVTNGVPVAIGMRRLVNQDDAVTFSSTFYRTAFEAIKNAAEGAPTLEWADALVPARRALRDNAGADPTERDEWTLPILYAGSGTFTLGAPGTTADQGVRDAVQGLIDVLGDGGQDFAAALAALVPQQ